MGKQLQVLMNTKDEENFISFLRATANLQLFESFAPTTNQLCVEKFSPNFDGHHTYAIWNTNFSWKPEYGIVGSKAHDPNLIGWSYISNLSAAPVIEVSRSNLAKITAGRLYWAKNFSAPNGLPYDEVAFAKWVDTIWRWVRKNGKKVPDLPLQPYVFPEAFNDLKRNSD